MRPRARLPPTDYILRPRPIASGPRSTAIWRQTPTAGQGPERQAGRKYVSAWRHPPFSVCAVPTLGPEGSRACCLYPDFPLPTTLPRAARAFPEPLRWRVRGLSHTPRPDSACSGLGKQGRPRGVSAKHPGPHPGKAFLQREGLPETKRLLGHGAFPHWKWTNALAAAKAEARAQMRERCGKNGVFPVCGRRCF